MTRLEKKCFIAASGTHGLLLVILLVGPAFLGAKDQVQPVQLITVVDLDHVTDGPTTGGSRPAVAPPPPPATEQHQQPNPPAEPVHIDPPKHEVTPEPPKHEPKPDKSLEPDKPKTHVSKLTPEELKLVKPKNNTSQSNERQQREAAEQHQRDLANQQRIAAIKSSLRSLDGKFGKAVAIDAGPVGNGGEAMINYRDLVASKYTIEWAPPASLDDENAVVTVSIVIARDGRVMNSRIVRPSGNPAMDKSIDSLLDRVTFIAPFPKSSDDAQRTFTIKFNLEAKRGLG